LVNSMFGKFKLLISNFLAYFFYRCSHWAIISYLPASIESLQTRWRSLRFAESIVLLDHQLLSKGFT
jgi:hypothetical protein